MTMLLHSFVFACAVASLCIGSRASADTERCSWPAPIIEITQLAVIDPALDVLQSRESIRLRREARGASRSRELSFGYYEASADTTYDAELQGRTLANGNLCLGVKTLAVRFGLKSRRILIAQELTPHPCMLDYVTRHERRHAVVDDELVAGFVARLRAQLVPTWEGGLGVEARDEADGLAALKGRIDARLAEFRSQFVVERDVAQDAVDAKDFAPGALSPACQDEQRQLFGANR